jgi:hypothetical protein
MMHGVVTEHMYRVMDWSQSAHSQLSIELQLITASSPSYQMLRDAWVTADGA